MDCESSNKLSKKKSIRKHKSTKKRRKHDSSGDESIDMSENCFPILHYLDDREEMIKQLFSVIEKEKLNCMLPPILKGLTMNALQQQCLQELRNMSDNEIRTVLCGEPIEMAPETVTTHVDSDSCESVEEYPHEDQERKTLLDILEQEMQEIAYNTVLKSDLLAPESEDELPEVVAIIPTASPSRAKNNVLLICIDSDDEELRHCALSPQPPGETLEAGCNAASSNTSTSEVQPLLSSCPTDAQGESEEKNGQPHDSIDPAINRNKKEDHQSSHKFKNAEDPAPGNTGVQENFLIQVFSSKNSSLGRVVKKVVKSAGRDVECNAERLGHEKSKQEKNSSIQVEDMDQEVIVVPLMEERVCIDESFLEANSKMQPVSSKNQSKTDCDTNAISQLLYKSTEPKVIDPTCTNQDDYLENSADLHEAEEKEEGEISDEEPEKSLEVLETEGDHHQSPTINLSSDGFDVKSDSEESETIVKVRKHHRRHRKSRRNTESPERSRRRIEKRGNRSYRRRTSPSAKESPISVPEEVEQEAQHSELEYIHCAKEKTECKVESSVSKTSKMLLTEDVSQSAEPSEEISGKADDTNNPESPNPRTEEDLDFDGAQNVKSPSCIEKNKSPKNLDFLEEPEPSEDSEPVATKTSWADRWAEKKDLKKVVITSKICRNVRKRILSARKKQSNQETTPVIEAPTLPPVPPLVLHVEGSVQEYQMLQLMDLSDNELLDRPCDKESCRTKALELVTHQGEACVKTLGHLHDDTMTDPDVLSSVPLPGSGNREDSSLAVSLSDSGKDQDPVLSVSLPKSGQYVGSLKPVPLPISAMDLNCLSMVPLPPDSNEQQLSNKMECN